MEDPTRISQNLDNAYQKSLNIALSLSQNKEYLLKAPSKPKDYRLARYIDKEHKQFRTLYHKYVDKSPTKYTHTQSSRDKSSSQTLPKDRSLGNQLTGKVKLRSSLLEGRKQIRQIKAGGSHKQSYLQNISPPLIERMKQSRDVSPTIKLPNVSLVTGKTTPSLELPNFREYSLNNSTTQKPKLTAFDRIQAMNSALSDLGKELIGLEIFNKLNPGISHTYDRRILMKLYANPHTQSNTIKKYVAKYGNGGTAPSEKSVRHPRAASSMDSYSKDPETAVLNCSTNFNQSKTNQNSKLNMILQKLEQERPFVLNKKLQMISADKCKFADPKLSLSKFNEFKKIADHERVERIRLAKNQVSIYRDLLEHLKRQNEPPSSSQLQFVEAVKDILESGWPLTLESVTEIEKTIADRESIATLLEIAQKNLRH